MHGGYPRLEDLEDVNALFRQGCLTVSFGPIEAIGNEFTYAASTIKGMSGGPVVYKGTAIGMCPKH